MNSFNYRYSKSLHQPLAFSPAMGFPTLVTPTHCSGTLQEWIAMLTEADREKLRLWGIPSKLLKAADVEVS